MLTTNPNNQPVIQAPEEFKAKMRQLFAQPPISFEKALAQTQAAARTRTASERNSNR